MNVVLAGVGAAAAVFGAVVLGTGFGGADDGVVAGVAGAAVEGVGFGGAGDEGVGFGGAADDVAAELDVVLLEEPAGAPTDGNAPPTVLT
jgi:hypothetical protein